LWRAKAIALRRSVVSDGQIHVQQNALPEVRIVEKLRRK